MNEHDQLTPLEPADPDPFHGLFQDWRTLIRAAGHLRWLAWLGIVWFGIFCIFLVFVVPAGAAVLQIIVAIVVIAVPFAGIIGLYFILARYISRAHTWAVCVAFGLVVLLFLLLLLRIVLDARIGVGSWMLHTLYLVFHLNLLKLLFQSFGAAHRIHAHIHGVDDVLPVDEDR